MIEAFLVPENTVVNANGDGPALDVIHSEGRMFLLRLANTNNVEQESLDVSIHGSSDGAIWDGNPIKAFPQKFYREEVPLLLNLTAHPEVKFIRAHWEVKRWGRGVETPRFEFCVPLREFRPRFSARATG